MSGSGLFNKSFYLSFCIDNLFLNKKENVSSWFVEKFILSFFQSVFSVRTCFLPILSGDNLYLSYSELSRQRSFGSLYVKVKRIKKKRYTFFS